MNRKKRTPSEICYILGRRLSREYGVKISGHDFQEIEINVLKCSRCGYISRGFVK